MKKLIIILMLIISAQTFAQSKIYNLDKPADSVGYKLTSDVAIYKGETRLIWVSKKGKRFIFVTSKKGNKYKKYLN